jgi:hypothetical protein
MISISSFGNEDTYIAHTDSYIKLINLLIKNIFEKKEAALLVG